MAFELAPAGDFLMARLGRGVDFYARRSDKFKTVDVGAFLHRPLTRETVTQTALAAQLLRRGCRRYPTMRDLTIRTDELFGAGLDTYVMKYGESQSIGFSLSVVDRRYLPSGADDVLEQGLSLLFEVMGDPVTEAGGFLPEYFEQERDNLRRRIQGLINDKQRYARIRCLEEMCAGEGYGLLELGRLKDFPGLDPVMVYGGYRRMLERMPIDIITVGAVEPEAIADHLAQLIPPSEERLERVGAVGTAPPPAEPREVVESQDVKQGKLVIGYRCGITQADPDYPALLAYNGVLGGFVHSKLFQNVRERASLAYYAHSLVNGAKGIILIESGIDSDRYEQVREIIDRQLSAIRAGEISDYEFDSTHKALENVIRQGQDDPGDMISVQLAEVRAGRARTVEERLRETAAVTRDDIARVAERVVLDTVFFLEGRAKAGEVR